MAEAELAEFRRKLTNKGDCVEVSPDKCGVKTGYNTCLKCGSASSYDCEECCPGLDKCASMSASDYC